MSDATPFDFTAEQRRYLEGLVAGMRAAKSVTHGGSPTMMRRPRYSPSRPKHATRPTSTESVARTLASRSVRVNKTFVLNRPLHRVTHC